MRAWTQLSGFWKAVVLIGAAVLIGTKPVLLAPALLIIAVVVGAAYWQRMTRVMSEAKLVPTTATAEVSGAASGRFREWAEHHAVRLQNTPHRLAEEFAVPRAGLSDARRQALESEIAELEYRPFYHPIWDSALLPAYHETLLDRGAERVAAIARRHGLPVMFVGSNTSRFSEIMESWRAQQDTVVGAVLSGLCTSTWFVDQGNIEQIREHAVGETRGTLQHDLEMRRLFAEASRPLKVLHAAALAKFHHPSFEDRVPGHVAHEALELVSRAAAPAPLAQGAPLPPPPAMPDDIAESPLAMSSRDGANGGQSNGASAPGTE